MKQVTLSVQNIRRNMFVFAPALFVAFCFFVGGLLGTFAQTNPSPVTPTVVVSTNMVPWLDSGHDGAVVVYTSGIPWSFAGYHGTLGTPSSKALLNLLITGLSVMAFSKVGAKCLDGFEAKYPWITPIVIALETLAAKQTVLTGQARVDAQAQAALPSVPVSGASTEKSITVAGAPKT